MKKNKNLKEFARQIQENNEGKLEGGFTIITAIENAVIIGGDVANNCNGGNCVSGCTTNIVKGCGGGTNAVPHCGG
jgi:hypothetical protein